MNFLYHQDKIGVEITLFLKVDRQKIKRYISIFKKLFEYVKRKYDKLELFTRFIRLVCRQITFDR